MMAWIWRIVGLLLLGWCVSAATLLPNGEQQFVDGNGVPYANGSVYFYIPNTLTPKTTWQDAGQTTPNANPVVLDGAGRAIIYGAGIYRQILKDQFGATVWDQLTAGGSSGNQSISPVLTGSGTLTLTSNFTFFPVNRAVPAAGTINLPASPTAGDTYTVKDAGGNWATYPQTISGNGVNIDGQPSVSLIFNWVSATFIFNGTQWNEI